MREDDIKEILALEDAAQVMRDKAARLQQQAREALEVSKKMRQAIMEEMKEDAVCGERVGKFSLSWRPGQQRVVIPNVNAVPDEFLKFEPKPDKAAIKSAIENGGCNWAYLEADDVLTIRMI